MAAKMSKKKGGGKKKEKLENMKKEMEIVSVGGRGVGTPGAGLRWGPEARQWAGWGCGSQTVSVLSPHPQNDHQLSVSELEQKYQTSATKVSWEWAGIVRG